MGTNYDAKMFVGDAYERMEGPLTQYVLANYVDKLEYFDPVFDERPNFYDVMHTLERETGIKITNFGTYPESSIYDDWIGIEIKNCFDDVSIADVECIGQVFTENISKAIAELKILTNNENENFMVMAVPSIY